ncbi:unnamed protein product [Diamesa tonsa]
MIPLNRNIDYMKTSLRELKTLKITMIFSIISIIGSVYWVQLKSTNSEDVEFLRTRLSDFNKQLDEINKYNPTHRDQQIDDMIKKLSNIPEPVTNKKITEIKKLYDKAEKYIERMQNYFHDQTGRPDLALESAGARVISVGNTKLLYQGGMRTWLLRSMGFIERSITNSPRFAIQSSMELGNCFCFHGQTGLIVIGLARKAFIDSFTIQHISPHMSPNGNINNAPKDISLWVRILLSLFPTPPTTTTKRPNDECFRAIFP